MNFINLSFRNSTELKLFIPKYLKKDYYLFVNTINGGNESLKRLSINTLSFFWNNEDNSISGIEAYTNIDRWDEQSFLLPTIDRTGTIYCINSFDHNNIAVSIDHFNEDWAFNSKLSLLRITFPVGKTTQRIRAGKNIITGVNDSMVMTELWVENLTII